MGRGRRLKDLPNRLRQQAERQLGLSLGTPDPAPDLEPDPRDAPVDEEEAPRLPTPCRIHVHSVRYRLADADGISAKAAIDGLVHAGLLPDDKAQFVEGVSYSQEKIRKADGPEKTILEFYHPEPPQ